MPILKGIFQLMGFWNSRLKHFSRMASECNTNFKCQICNRLSPKFFFFLCHVMLKLNTAQNKYINIKDPKLSSLHAHVSVKMLQWMPGNCTGWHIKSQSMHTTVHVVHKQSPLYFKKWLPYCTIVAWQFRALSEPKLSRLQT